MKSPLFSGDLQNLHFVSAPLAIQKMLILAVLIALQLFNASAAAPDPATHFDFSSDTTPSARKFYFETTPGHRYKLWCSTNLKDWELVPDYPKIASGAAMEHSFTQDVKEFFRVESIDDHAPEIVEQFPQADSFAIRRFDDLRFRLSDANGIDASSIRLFVGNGGEMTVTSSGVSFVNNVLTYDSGDAALGNYEATVPVTLTVADTLGHTMTQTFSFTLEVLPKVVPNLYVFGSPTAQRAGQRLPATPTAALAKQSGPIRMDAADPWEISSILPERVIITYTGSSAPVFEVGNYLTNLTPVKISDIFYRKVVSMSNSPAEKKLTIMTTDVPLAEILEEGSATLSAESVIYDLDALGGIQPSQQKSVTKNFSRTFTPFGINLDGAGPWEPRPGSKFSLSTPEANIWFTPSLDISFQTKGFSVQRAVIQARCDVDLTLIAELMYGSSGSEKKHEWPLHTPVGKAVFLGSAGPVPIWLDFTYSTKLKVEG